MTKLTIDAETRARLNDLQELLEICDESGRILGYFHPTACMPEKIESPLNREELQRRRQERTGRPLTDILKGLSEA